MAFFLVSCTGVSKEKACTINKDCVPSACCHATDAVNKESGPDCTGMLCTAECVPDTIDCGQGEIKCVEGACQAILK